MPPWACAMFALDRPMDDMSDYSDRNLADTWMAVLGKADSMAIRDSRASMAAARFGALEAQACEVLQHTIFAS